MTLELRERTESHVRINYEKMKDPQIKSMIPMTEKTLEQALADYEKTRLPGASSFGLTVYADCAYVGDVWCYGMDLQEDPNAMIGYCIFEKSLWGKGIATEAVKRFLETVTTGFGLKAMGAVAYWENLASGRVLEKNGFERKEEFTEDGVRSVYFQKELAV